MNRPNVLPAPTAMCGRRQVISGISVAFGGLILGSARVLLQAEEVSAEISHSAESIHQEVEFKASRKRLFEALTITEQFDKVTRLGVAMRSAMALGSAPTEIEGHAGGTFTIFGGYIVGRQLEIVPQERIVQAWRAGSWEPGIFSIARFELVKQDSGTKLIFDHTGFPKGQGEHLAAGWKGNYWEPLAKFVA